MNRNAFFYQNIELVLNWFCLHSNVWILLSAAYRWITRWSIRWQWCFKLNVNRLFFFFFLTFFCATVAEVGFPQFIGPEQVKIEAHLGNACTTQLPDVSSLQILLLWGFLKSLSAFWKVCCLGDCALQDSSCLFNVEHLQILKRTRHSSTGWSMTNSLKTLPARIG